MRHDHFILSQRSINIANGKCIFDFDGSANAIEAAGLFKLWSADITAASPYKDEWPRL